MIIGMCQLLALQQDSVICKTHTSETLIWQQKQQKSATKNLMFKENLQFLFWIYCYPRSQEGPRVDTPVWCLMSVNPAQGTPRQKERQVQALFGLQCESQAWLKLCLKK